MDGLSNRGQALLISLSAFLIVLGTAGATLPNFIPDSQKTYFALFFWICGLVGLALKEALGGKAPPPATQNTTSTTPTS